MLQWAFGLSVLTVVAYVYARSFMAYFVDSDIEKSLLSWFSTVFFNHTVEIMCQMFMPDSLYIYAFYDFNMLCFICCIC